MLRDFYPRPPRGGRLCPSAAEAAPAQFLSTPSARRATTNRSLLRTSWSNFYPRPPRGGRRSQSWQSGANHSISIHALREEGDRRRCTRGSDGKISIHALREEGDLRSCPVYGLPVISIHALREEGDPNLTACRLQYSVFLSTPSARRATSVIFSSSLSY